VTYHWSVPSECLPVRQSYVFVWCCLFVSYGFFLYIYDISRARYYRWPALMGLGPSAACHIVIILLYYCAYILAINSVRVCVYVMTHVKRTHCNTLLQKQQEHSCGPKKHCNKQEPRPAPWERVIWGSKRPLCSHTTHCQVTSEEDKVGSS